MNMTRNIAIPKMHLNRSLDRENTNYRFYYGNSDTVEAVREIYARDISVFEYAF